MSEADAAFERVAEAFTGATRAAGWDIEMGPLLPSMFENAGLVDISAESWQTYGHADTHAILFANSCKRLRERFIQHGATANDINDVVQRLTNASIGFFGPTSWTVCGRRPASAP